MIRRVWLALVVIFACATFAPNAPYHRFTAPAIYRQWYDSVWRHCGSTLRAAPDRTLDQIEFFEVDGTSFYVHGVWAAGAYTNGRIYLASPYVDPAYWAAERVVKHELLHAQLTEHVGHPPIFEQCHLNAWD